MTLLSFLFGLLGFVSYGIGVVILVVMAYLILRGFRAGCSDAAPQRGRALPMVRVR